MANIIAATSDFASAEDYTNLSENVEDICYRVNDLHHSFVTFTSEHQEEKENYNEELSQIKHDLHKLRVALRWALSGLLCSGIAILALCIHLIS